MMEKRTTWTTHFERRLGQFDHGLSFLTRELNNGSPASRLGGWLLACTLIALLVAAVGNTTTAMMICISIGIAPIAVAAALASLQCLGGLVREQTTRNNGKAVVVEKPVVEAVPPGGNPFSDTVLGGAEFEQPASRLHAN